MAGSIVLERNGPLARVTLANIGKHNAIDVAMWQALRATFEQLQSLPAAERRAHFAYAGSDEHREGIAALIEKRPPHFQRG